MEEKKEIQIVNNLAPDMKEIVVRQGVAPKVLDEVEPLPYKAHGTIGCIAEYLGKRINTGQFKQQDCTIYVNREAEAISLVFNERDQRNLGEVIGRIERTKDFESLRLNSGEGWSPEKLARLFKLHRNWFKSREENMAIVTTLLNYKADIKQKVERAMQENGSRAYNFAQEVNSNLPPKVTVSLTIFKGSYKQDIEIETLAFVDGESIVFELLSPGANEIIETYRDMLIDEQLIEIKKIAPDIAIIEQ